MNVTVIGLGLIGGSIAKELKRRGYASSVMGVDNNAEHAEQALEIGLVDRVASNTHEALEKAELVVVAVPVGKICELLPSLLEQSSSTQTTFVEVGSTKAKIALAVEGHAKRGQVVLTHPMAGTEFSGPTAAKIGLFENRSVVVCDAEKSGALHMDRVRSMYRLLGAHLIDMDSSEQDMHSAYISHLSHISSFMLASTVLEIEKDVESIFDLASGGFESTVRLAKSSPETWNPIFEQNQEYTMQALDAYIENLRRFREAMHNREWDKVKLMLNRANGIRRVLEGKK